jgi:hypothetical protein
MKNLKQITVETKDNFYDIPKHLQKKIKTVKNYENSLFEITIKRKYKNYFNEVKAEIVKYFDKNFNYVELGFTDITIPKLPF